MQTPDENYERIAIALDYMLKNFTKQPSLTEVAAAVNLSTAHFQRVFTDWAGTSPKKFLQYVSITYAKQLLNKQATLFDTAFETGLSGTGRLHDLFVTIEGMTPGQYKNKGADLRINYWFTNTHFGRILIASTYKGVCYLAFVENDEIALKLLKNEFTNATFKSKTDEFQNNALAIFKNTHSELRDIKLHLKGTDFQLKVWEALLKIPAGQLSTYGKIAADLGNKGASRAVGTAIGNNPVAYLIPCHRVIQASGIFGGYMWGPTRKAAIIGWEQSLLNDEAY